MFSRRQKQCSEAKSNSQEAPVSHIIEKSRILVIFMIWNCLIVFSDMVTKYPYFCLDPFVITEQLCLMMQVFDIFLFNMIKEHKASIQSPGVTFYLSYPLSKHSYTSCGILDG